MQINNEKPKKTLKKVTRNILMVVALLFSSLIGVFASLFSFLNKDSANVSAPSRIEHSLDNPSPLASGQTPDILYHLPTASGTGDGKVVADQANFPNIRANAWLNKYVTGMSTYQLPSELYSTYWLAASSLTHINEYPKQDEIQAFATKYSSYFVNRETVFESYQLANEFTGSIAPTTQLSVSMPREVRDVFSVNTTNPVALSHTNLAMNDFAYKVAEVDLLQLVNNKSLVFGFQNTADPNKTLHDYRLVFANEDGDISQFLNSHTGNLTIRDLINDNLIFIRDMNSNDEAIAKEPSSQYAEPLRHLTDTLKLTYNPVNKKVSILVVPAVANTRTAPVKFWYDATLSDTNATASFKYGILDNTLSPLHTKSFTDVDESAYTPWVYQYASDPIDPAQQLIPSDVSLVADTLPIFASKGKWDLEMTNTGASFANHIRIFMMPNTFLSGKVNFANDKNGSAAFENDQNEFKITYDNANTVTVSPRTFVIKTYAVNAAGANILNEPFNVFDRTLTFSENSINFNYSQVDVALPSGVLSINPLPANNRHEGLYALPLPTRRIFFEDPHHRGTSDFLNHNKQSVRVEGKVDGLQKNLEILGDIYRNWSGLETQSANSKSLIRPDTSIFNSNGLPGTPSGQAVFDSSIFDSTRTRSFPDDRFAITYKHYSLDRNGRVVLGDSRLQNLFQQKTDTLEFVLDSQGNKQPVTAVGSAIVNQLIMTSNAYVTWLVNRGNQSAGTAIDEYRLSKPSEASGFVETRIISRSGTVGRKLSDYSNALVLYWLGKVLSTDENNNLNEFKDLFNDRAGNSMLPSNFWAQIAGKGQPTGDPAYETKPEYLVSRQYVYYVIQYYMVAAINEVMKLETEKFENSKALYVRTALRNYLTRSNVDVVINGVHFRDPIAPNILVKESTTTPKFLTINAYGYSPVASGALEFASLIDTIGLLHLDERFLSTDAQAIFKTFVTSVLKAHAPAEWAQSVFNDGSNNEQEVSKFLTSLSSILEQTISASAQYKDSKLTPLSTVIDKIYNGDAEYTSPDKPIQAIATVVRANIALLSNPSELEKYVIRGLQNEYDANFLETQVVGNNLKLILEEYLKNNANKPNFSDDLRTKIQEFINLRSYYNLDQVALFAVHNGYESIRTFIDEITKTPAVTARFLVDRSIVVEKSWPLDNNNQIQNNLSNPNNIAKYSFIGFGAVAMLVGLAALGISFSRRGLFGVTVGTVIAVNIIFIAICALGAALFVVGLLPGIF